VHAHDGEASLVIARTGSVGKVKGGSRGMRLFTAEPALIRSGADINNLDLEIQNVRADAASVVAAGRDLSFDPNRNQRGQIAQSLEERNQGILVSGPGRALISAGRNIDLGTSDGIVSIGNKRNLALAGQGADLTVLAGVGRGMDLVGFYDAYVRNVPAAQAEALAFARDLTGVVTEEEANAVVAALRKYRAAVLAAGLDPDGERDRIQLSDPLVAILVDAFFNELRESGSAAVASERIGFGRGFAAIERLFADPEAAGDLSLLVSRIHSEDGGDIDLLVPGGSANAGASAEALRLQDPITGVQTALKGESQLGIVAQAAGDVRGFVRDDFFVNASRVFALQGGDIVIWASTGDIDAGRGAKSALAAPPPQVVFDPSTGQFETIFPPEVSGSGIRNFAPPGVPAGDVFLFAPQGTVSAGDAGIASAGNITIGATEVIGADNIDVGGASIGVPTGDVGIAAGLTGVSNVASSASKGAQDSAADRVAGADAAAETFAQPSLSIITVEVIGFGS